VATLAAGRGTTRLCHLTAFRNLLHLATEGQGLLSLRQLAAQSGDYDQQDLERLDGHPDHICCSIQYPNAWYLRNRKVRATPIQRLFPDWVCLTIDPKHLWSSGTRVCVRNAAALGGTLIEDISVESFEALFASSIIGADGRTYRRGVNRIAACPTDDQGEVLVHRRIPLADVHAVIVASESDAKRFHAALDQVGAATSSLGWAVAPVLFNANALSGSVASGTAPTETPWTPA
jgi:hypothetical protein